MAAARIGVGHSVDGLGEPDYGVKIGPDLVYVALGMSHAELARGY